jgi:hypothetical protein
MKRCRSSDLAAASEAEAGYFSLVLTERVENY